MESKHIYLTILLTVLYAACYPMIKAGLPYAPPLLFGGLRTLLAGTVLLVYAFIRRDGLLPARKSWKELLVLAFVGTTLVFGAMFLSPDLAGAGIASILGNTQALFTVALAAVFLGERLTTGKTTALVLGLSGVILIAYPALKASSMGGILGIGLALTVSAGAAVSNIIVKRSTIKRDLLAFAGWQLVLGSLPLLFSSRLFEQGHEPIWNAKFISLLLFLALMGTAFPTAVWYWLIRQDDVGKLSLFFFLIPIFGLAFAAFVLKEAINFHEIIGVVVILAGIGIFVWEALHTPYSAYTYCPVCHTKIAL